MAPNVKEIDIIIVDAELRDWVIMDNTFIGINEINSINISDKDEGGVLEKQVWAPLESIFPESIYKNPRIEDKYGYRELTDVLCFHQYGIFLIETKALSLLELENERDMDRKIKGIQKQINKGIDQLKGASKKITSNAHVYDSVGNILHFDRTIGLHCIVLVSELLAFGDWKDIEVKMQQTMIDQPMYLNVMDLSEFMTYIGICRGNQNIFDVNLIKRTEQFVQHQTIHMRANRSANNYYNKL